MRLVWVILPLVLFGIVEIYQSEARECISPCYSNHYRLKITDLDGTSLNGIDTNQQVIMSHVVAPHHFRSMYDAKCIAMNMSVNCLSDIMKSYVVGDEIFQKNYGDEPFAILFQVQNQDGITTYLSWVEGQINPDQVKKIESIWTPNESGTYTVVAFVWTAIDNPTALATPVSTTIVVRD